MRRNYFIAVIIVLVISTTTFSAYGKKKAWEPKNLILFSWDGTEKEIFDELLEEGKLPFVSTLTIITHYPVRGPDGEGTLATRAQHSLMLSGLPASITGIYSNKPELNDPPGRKAIDEEYLIFPKLKIWFKYIRRYEGHFRIGGGCSKAEPVGALLGFNLSEGMKEKWFYNESGFDIFYFGRGIISRKYSVSEPFLSIATDDEPYFYFFHFSDPDHKGHNYGRNSTEYREALMACDNLTRVIYEKLAPTKPAIIVTSDHGFNLPFGHRGGVTFLATNLDIKHESSNMPDIALTIYDYLKIRFGVFRPKLWGKSLLSD